MSFLSAGFRWSFMFFALCPIRQAFVDHLPRKLSIKKRSAAPIGTQHCNNVYFYEASDKKIETTLNEMKKQLAQVLDGINILKGNKTSVKGRSTNSDAHLYTII